LAKILLKNLREVTSETRQNKKKYTDL